MTNFPFGFGKPGGGDGEGENDPNDLSSQMPLFAELQKLLSWSGGPVNWDLAKQLAVSNLGGSTIVSPADRTGVAEAIRLADHWLDDATDLPSGLTSIESWTRLEWLDKSLPVWSALCDPVASRVTAAMSQAIPKEQLEAFGAGNPFAGIMNQVGGLMFGAQVGQGLGGMAQEVLSATDIGIPLGPEGVAALVPENVNEYAKTLERKVDEVRLYLALREAAHQRLFTHVPWLRTHLLETVESYAKGISIDMSSIEEAMQGLDPMNPESMQQAVSGGLFAPKQTPDQEIALRRLETLLALVEGWVDTVVNAAAGERMPGAEALREASRRRRASGGPAEQTFATLVGLELRPRRLRDAATLWWAVTEQQGVGVRDSIWTHPDLLPTTDDLDDPLAFAGKPVDLAAFTAPDDLSGLDLSGIELDPEPGAGDDPKTDDPKTDDPKTDDPKTDDPKTDDPKPDEPKPRTPPPDQSVAESSSTSPPRSSAMGRFAAALTPSRYPRARSVRG